MKTSAPKISRGANSSTSPLPNPVTLALGQNLKRHREAANKTQVELAYDAEVERSRISKIECGYVSHNTQPQAVRIEVLRNLVVRADDGDVMNAFEHEGQNQRLTICCGFVVVFGVAAAQRIKDLEHFYSKSLIHLVV